MFKSAGEFVRESLDEMKQKYEAQRDNEFAAHVVSSTQESSGQRLNRSQRSLRTS